MLFWRRCESSVNYCFRLCVFPVYWTKGVIWINPTRPLRNCNDFVVNGFSFFIRQCMKLIGQMALAVLTKPSKCALPFDLSDQLKRQNLTKFVQTVANERALLNLYLTKLQRLDPDIIVVRLGSYNCRCFAVCLYEIDQLARAWAYARWLILSFD